MADLQESAGGQQRYRYEATVHADETERLKREFLDAIEDEKDAASRAAALADELREHGVDPDELDSRP